MSVSLHNASYAIRVVLPERQEREIVSVADAFRRLIAARLGESHLIRFLSEAL